MAITLKRQLSEAEKDEVLRNHGRICFATGHAISEEETVQFDHIRAFAEGGSSDINNIAPMCSLHNQMKGTLPLNDFRVKLRLDHFFTSGDSQTLKQLLAYLKQLGDVCSYGQNIIFQEKEDCISIESVEGIQTYPLFKCPITGWKYFYATLPVALLDSDDDVDHQIGLQPRYLIPEKVFDLYRHFQYHPVLQPSIGRINQQKIVLFDGQHKVAAMLWNGRREFECKIYLSADLSLLNQTNIAAHDKFAQTRFYTSIMVLKLGSQFGTEFENYKNHENGEVKSEAGFMRYLESDPQQTMTRGERNERFRSYLYNSILEDPENHLAALISKGNRSTDEKPLTIDMLKKSIFACFLYTDPVEDNLATESYKRDKEIANIITLMNMLYELALFAWNPKAGLHDSNQIKLRRIFSSKSMMAWSELLRDAICGKLDLQDIEDRTRPFYRDFQSDEISRIKRVVVLLMNWKYWNSPANSEIDRVIAGNKSTIKDWLKQHDLTTGYLMGAPNN